MSLRTALIILAVLALPQLAAGEEGWTFRGHLQAGSRDFLVDRDTGLHDDNVDLQAELDAMYTHGPVLVRLRPYLAIDPLERNRDRYEPLDAYVDLAYPRWDILVGQLVENWAIVDTYNPADILNRRDLERDFYDPPKLGELMVRFRYLFPETDWLQQPALSLYVLPLHRETPLPSNRDRFRFDATGDNLGDLARDAITPSPDIAYAARLTASLNAADVFLFYFGGPTRIPAFDVSPLGRVTAVYYRIDVAGVGLQWPMGPWLLKLESAYTWTHDSGLPTRFVRDVPDDYFQWVIGVDRNFTDILGKNEITVTLEYAGEDDTTQSLSHLQPYKSDVFVGLRWQFHDMRRTEVHASVAADVLVDEQLYKVEVQTDLYKQLKLVLAGQFVNRAPDRRPDRFTTFNLFPNNSNISVGFRYDF